eukprot:scaffold3257_cov152-Amphora_coffeaeformis.AAC.4
MSNPPTLGEIFDEIRIPQADQDILVVKYEITDTASLKAKWTQVKNDHSLKNCLDDLNALVCYLRRHTKFDADDFLKFVIKYANKPKKNSYNRDRSESEFRLHPQGFDPSDETTEEEEDGIDVIKDSREGPEELEFDGTVFKKGHCYFHKHSEDQPLIVVGIRSLEKDVLDPKAHCSMIVPVSETFLGRGEDGRSEVYSTKFVQVRSIKNSIPLAELSEGVSEPKLMPKIIYQAQKEGSKRSFAYEYDGSNPVGLRGNKRNIELFCGSGGMHLGYKAAGFKTVKAIDKDEMAIKTFCRNNPEDAAAAQEICVLEFIQNDLSSLGSVEVLHASSPCQGFSSANRRATNVELTDKDKANNELAMTFPAALGESKSLVGIFENVPGIWSKRGMPYLRRMLFELVDMNYMFRTMVLNGTDAIRLSKPRAFLTVLHSQPSPSLITACDYGDPQSRPRFFIFAARHFVRLPLPPPRTHVDPHKKTSVSRTPWMTTGNALEIFSMVPPNHFPNMSIRKKSGITPGEQDTVLLEKDKIASALRAGGPAIFHYIPDTEGKPQCITVREAAALQSYPNDYKFLGKKTQQYKQAGNSVPCCLAKAVAQAAALSVRHRQKQQLSWAISEIPNDETRGTIILRTLKTHESRIMRHCKTPLPIAHCHRLIFSCAATALRETQQHNKVQGDDASKDDDNGDQDVPICTCLSLRLGVSSGSSLSILYTSAAATSSSSLLDDDCHHDDDWTRRRRRHRGVVVNNG